MVKSAFGEEGFNLVTIIWDFFRLVTYYNKSLPLNLMPIPYKLTIYVPLLSLGIEPLDMLKLVFISLRLATNLF
jgi:hypothetical protein